VAVAPLDSTRPEELASNLRGAATLYNTYWIRFAHGSMTYERAIENSRTLFRAARNAGVRRIVHVSIANPSLGSPLPYYSGKARVEEAVTDSGLSYAILRPTVIFGDEDILINNIAWLVRKFPVFAIPGSGEYRLQPIFVEDFAELAVRAGQASENTVTDAVGPEVYTFKDLVRLVASAVGRPARLVHMHPGLVCAACSLLSVVLRDVLLTREEIEGLMAELLVSHAPATGRTRLSDWLLKNSHKVGTRYASELARHYRL
jgi:NADH dehydrogenase